MQVTSTQHVVESVIWLGAKASKMGWTVATGGNFSVRIDDKNFAISRSGVEKGQMEISDVLMQNTDIPPVLNASAETAIHQAIYKSAPHVGAIMHVHSRGGILASLTAEKMRDNYYILSGYELLKAIHGIKTHEAKLKIPVYHNSQNILLIAEQISCYMNYIRQIDEIAAPCFLLVGHGLTVWGKNALEVFKHTEAIEFLLSIDLERKRFNI